MDITLEEMKLQCRIDGDEEIELLYGYLLAAKSMIENYTNRQLFSVLPLENVPSNALEITADLKVAILMLVAYLYENRSGVNELNQGQYVSMPPTIKMMIERYTYIAI